MTLVSFPNPQHAATSGGDAALTLNENEQMLAALGGTGFIGPMTDDPPVFSDSTGRHVIIRAGTVAALNGTIVRCTADHPVPIPANNSGNPRADLVVFRLRRAASSVGAGDEYTVSPFVHVGAPAATPVLPSYTRNPATNLTGFWDLPIRRVDAPQGTAVVTSGQSTHQGWWITASGYAGYSTSRPPIEPGVTFHERDTGNVLVGFLDDDGNYQRDVIRFGKGVQDFGSPGGYGSVSFKLMRSADLVNLGLRMTRTGGGFTQGTAMQFGNFGPDFRPVTAWPGYARISAPEQMCGVTANTAGQLIFNHDGVSNGALIELNMTWPAARPAA